MKVLFVAHGPNQLNGPNIWLTRILPRLRDRGISSSVLFVMNRNERCAVVGELDRQGIPCYSIPRGYTEDLTVHILQFVKEFQPDVFIPNLCVPAYFAAGWVRSAGIPTIGVVRSDDSFHWDLVDEFIFGQPRFHLSAAVCKSEYLEQSIQKRQPPDTRLMRCPSGAPVPPQCAGFDQARFGVTYVGRLVERQKRISDVLSAAERVVKDVPRTEAVIYGAGPEQEAVKRRISSFAQPERFRYGGVLLPDAIQAEIVKHHALLLLSDYEGLSTALVEAMACGLVPIVTNMRSGISDIIEDGVNGIIVSDRSSGVSSAVARLASDESLWTKMSKAARATVEKKFSSDISADKWALFLKEIVNSIGVGKKEIVIPPAEELHLPPVRIAEGGMSREDERRLPTTREKEVELEPTFDQKIDAEFLNPPLIPEFIDLFIVRSSILGAVKKIAPLMHGDLLDVGCGVMPYRSILTSEPSKVSNYIGMDIESDIYQADVDVRWDGKAIPLKDAAVDCAMATEVLEHCPDPGVVLGEIKRVLKPSGVFFFTVPFLWPIHDSPWDFYRYTPFALKTLLEDAGFRRIEIEALGGWNASLAQMIGLWLRRSGIDDESRAEYTQKLQPLYEVLLRGDKPVDPFSNGAMATGWYGIAYK